MVVTAAATMFFIILVTSFSLSGQIADHFIRRPDGVSEGGSIDFVRGMHLCVAEGGGRVTYQRDVVAKLHCVLGCGLDAGLGNQADNDHVGDAVLLELHVEIGVGEAALPPMLGGDDVARLRREIRVEFAAPFATCEVMTIHDLALRRAGMVPTLIIARFPAPMR